MILAAPGRQLPDEKTGLPEGRPVVNFGKGSGDIAVFVASDGDCKFVIENQ